MCFQGSGSAIIARATEVASQSPRAMVASIAAIQRLRATAMRSLSTRVVAGQEHGLHACANVPGTVPLRKLARPHMPNLDLPGSTCK